MRRYGQGLFRAASLAIVLLTGAPKANAAGFASARFGGEHGTPVDTNPTALYYNPGAIGFSDGINLFLDGQIALRHATWSHTAPTPDPNLSQSPDMQVGNSGQASLFNVFGGPALGATMKIDNVAFGAGLFVPFGGRAHFDKNNTLGAPQSSAYPGAVDGVQRWTITDGALTFIYATVGAAYHLGPVSLGVSGNAVLSQVQLSQAVNPFGLPDATKEGRESLDVSGFDLSFGVGAMVEVLPKRVWVGASYQSQPGLGTQTLRGTFDLRQTVGSTDAIHQQATFTQALPDIYRGGAKWRANEQLELRAFGDFTRWSVMKAQCVALRTPAAGGGLDDHPCQVFANGSDASNGNVLANHVRNWKDTYGVRLGGSYWVKPEIEVFAGVGYETGATPDATVDPATMDGDNLGAALGGRFYLFDAFYLAASYTHLQFLARDNTGKSQLEAINGVGILAPTQQQDAGGKYTQWIGIVDINVQKQF